MIKTDEILRTETGRNLKIIELIQAGVQGCTAKAQDMDVRKDIEAVKVFHPDHTNSETIERTAHLCSQKLSEGCPALVAPVELIRGNGRLGYTMRYVQGVPMIQYLETERPRYVQLLVALALVTNGIAYLHARKISHGDIRHANVLIGLVGSVMRPFVIDLDNFSAPGVPKPTCLGDEMYLAPELRTAFKTGKPVYPDIGSDKFAYRIMAEELLTLRHPSAGFHKPTARFEEAMYRSWFYDPALRPGKGVGGYPPGVLNARLAHLMRRGMSADPKARPEMTEWLDALIQSLGDVHICPHPGCGGPCLADVSKTHCPFCNRPYPPLCLALADGHKIPITGGFMQIGRMELRAGDKVSAIHAVFRKIGPAVRIECYGMNGTYRKTKDSWVRLEDRKPITISAGDVLRFADVEVKVEQ